MSRLLIMAGGTGGHVMPALAVARRLIEEGVEVSWIGTRQGIEARLVQAAQIRFDTVDIKGLRKSGWLRKITMPFMLIKAMGQTMVVLTRRKPNAVLGMGGFVSGPGGLVAAMMRLPLVLHEQNSVAGLTNRWLARYSYRTLTGFPSVEGFRQYQWTGNPVRQEITRIPEPAVRLAGRQGALRILVIGGSQGAGIFNQSLPQLLARLGTKKVEIRHQCGANNSQTVDQAYGEIGLHARVEEFIEDMPEAYAWSDVVICRSGAMTVSEICCAGAVAIFVPYPYAVNDHQQRNALWLVDNKASHMVLQAEFGLGKWLQILERWYENRKGLLTMAQGARKLAKPLASEEVAAICREAMDA